MSTCIFSVDRFLLLLLVCALFHFAPFILQHFLALVFCLNFIALGGFLLLNGNGLVL